MYKKINFYLRFSALFSMLLSSIFILVACYGIFTSELNEEIESEINIIVRVLNDSSDYVETFKNAESDLNRKQLILVDKDNSVIYNFNMSEKNVNNILKRNSNITNGEYKLNMFVHGVVRTLENGNRIFVLFSIQNPWTIMLTFFVLIGVMVLLIYLISVSVSMRITESIIRPIEKSYSFDRENYDDIYDEIQPFLKRIARQNKEIRKNMEELKRAEKIRSEFSANVSHELKTPLTSIKGFSQIIENGIAKEDDIPKFARKIEKESSRLIILIDDIIKLSDLDENGANVQKSRINLKDAALQVYERILPIAENKGILLNIEGEDAEVFLNTYQVDELIYNLVDNAIKYNKDNGSVTIKTGTDDNKKSYVKVTDTGIGIPDEYLDRIFERFFRVDKSHSKLINGTGLGLSIVKHIAMAAGADINVKSEIGKGTEFTVTFDSFSLK